MLTNRDNRFATEHGILEVKDGIARLSMPDQNFIETPIYTDIVKQSEADNIASAMYNIGRRF